MTDVVVRAYIALGSNLENPKAQIESALVTLNTIPHSSLIKTSRFYRSTPLSGDDQPDYINAVAAFDTTLSAHDLLTELQKIEQSHGRTRSLKRWGPRTLDLDLVLYGDHIISTPRLLVPHPGISKRNFVLYPLADLDPNLIFPNGHKLQDLLEKVNQDGLVVIE